MEILDKPEVQEIKIKDCGEPLILLDESEFIIEPMYYNWGYTDTNFIKLRKGVVERLRSAKTALPKGWNFKIWDGYRTLETQKILYDNYWDELKAQNPDWLDEQLHKAVQIFVSPASRDRSLPSPHNTGGVMDLTLVNAEGREIPMGTNFDEFDVKSFTDHFKEGEFLENRMLLKKILEGVGFKNYHEEWWHYSYGDQEWARQADADFAIYGSMEI